MKYIRFIALIALILGGMTMKAQEYHPIVEDGKQWNVLFTYPWNPPEPAHRYTDIYKIEGDTLLDGMSYKMMYATRNEDLTGWNLWGFIRETENGQVFSRRPSTSDEQLLYDFSMEVGDTICMCDYGYDECCMVVIEKGETIVNGEPRQQIVLEYPWGGGDGEVWIEGIGSLYGIIDSGSHFLTGGSTNLLCYYEDGDLIWQNTSLGYDVCYFVYSGGGQQSGLVVTPTVLIFDEPAVPQTFTISNQFDNDVTITSIYVQPDDNTVLVSHTDLPQTLQPNESMDVEVELNAIGNKGYNTYHIYVLTSEGTKVVVVRVNENVWDEYYPLVQEGGRQDWNVLYIITGSAYPDVYHTDIQFIEGDSIIDGVAYRQAWVKGPNDNEPRIDGFVREEDKRVYYRRQLSYGLEEEVLLYDFNLTVGDTVTVNFGNTTLLVMEESEVEVDGVMRRQLGLGNPDNGLSPFSEVDEYWIEGVGSTHGFLNSGCEPWSWFGAFVHLLCYYENDDLIWDNEAFDGCVMNSQASGDDTLNAYCEAPVDFYGWPNIEQGTCMTWMSWHCPLGSKWFHYDEKPYAGSVWCNYWGIKIPAEEIQSGDVLTHVAFYKAGFQNHLADYVFAFSVGGDTEPDNLDFLPGNSVQIEPGPDEWVMVKLRHPIECEEGKSLWIILTAPNVEVSNAAYCQTSGNPDGRWASSSGGYWYDYSSVQGGGGDWMIRGYFNNWGYCNEDFDHYNLYRGRSLEELEKIAELDRDAVEYNDTLQHPFGDYYYSLTASYTDGRESDPEKAFGYFHVGNMSSLGSEWYYEIQNENGSITYQHLQYTADTTINHKDVKIIIRTNTLYDKGEHNVVTKEYIYEDFGKVYWWNETLQDFTLLYDLGAQIGDEWVIEVGTESITMHVDAVTQYEYEGVTYRMLHVSDADDLFSGEIMSGVGHLTSFFPERLMTRDKGYRVSGLRCYWIYGDLVFTMNRDDCDAIYINLHNGIEEDGPSTGSGSLIVYPNPTNGILFVQTLRATSLPDQTYRITNLMGQTVLTGTITAENQQIDVSNLPQGMYFITFAGETRKFVVNQ